jgi:hypothetical protein
VTDTHLPQRNSCRLAGFVSVAAGSDKTLACPLAFMQHFCGGMDHWILQAAANLPQRGGSSCLTMLELRVPAVKRLLQPAVWSPSDEVRRITGDTIRVDGRSKL